MGIIDDAADVGMGAIEEAGGFHVAYHRGDQSETILAVIDQSQSQDDDTGGQTTIVSRNDQWLIRRTRMRIGGVQTQPMIGDRIVTPAGREYHVHATGGPAWTWSDPRQTYFRISTIEMKS